MGAVLAIVGYAVGTAQVLFIDWVQRRREHCRHLRLLRAELTRTRALTAKFGWKKGVPPDSDDIPNLPTVSEQYTATVAATDYSRTDEHSGDNAQMAHLHLLDGLGILAKYHSAALALADKAREGGPTARKLFNRACENAAAYDETVDIVACTLDSALEDVERRLTEAKLWPQVGRIGRSLPEGTNPPPVAVR